MKKLLLLPLLITSAAAYSQTVVKKVVVEDYTGTWCGWCPEGTVILEQLEAANPDNMFAIGNHSGDALEVPEGAAIDAGLQVSGYPNGSVDRFLYPGEAKISMSRSKWQSKFNLRKATTAIASISFSGLEVNNATGTFKGTVNVKFVSAPTAGVPLSLQVYVMEDSIPATGTYAQGNYSTAVQGGASPLTNWFHNHTLRDALGGNWGWEDVIPATPQVGVTYSKEFEFVMPANFSAKHLHFLGFVAYNGTVANNQKEIINSEQIYAQSFGTLGGLKTFAKKELSIFPNPVSNTSQINLSYDLAKSGEITLNVYDITGKLVATPYQGYEIAGNHMLNFTAARHNLSAGVYYLKLSAGDETFTGKVSVQ